MTCFVKFRVFVVLVVGALLSAGCAPSFDDRASDLRDGTLEDVLAAVEGLDWGWEVTYASPAYDGPDAFNFQNEGNNEASEGDLLVETSAMPGVVTEDDLQLLVSGLAEGGFYLKIGSCTDLGFGGFFERADGGAVEVYVLTESLKATIETEFKMDHRLATIGELTDRTELESGCWPDPVVPEAIGE